MKGKLNLIKYISLAIVAVLLLCGAVWARMTAVVVGQGVPVAAPSCSDSNPKTSDGPPIDYDCTGFLICQNLEGTGYDNSETWSESTDFGGTADENDATATILRGSQQLKLVGGTGSYASATVSFADNSTVWLHVIFKPSDSTPASRRSWVRLLDSSDNELLSITVDTTGLARLYHGSVFLQTDSAIYADNTALHVWAKYTKGTGADGVAELYWAANGTLPSIPNSCAKAPSWSAGQACSLSTGTSTADVGKLQLREYANEMGGIYLDSILVKSTSIGSVCTD